MKNPMRKLIWTMVLSAPLAAWAASNSPDESFYKDAAQGGLAEVQEGQLAQEMGQSQAVKNFGRLMVQDHTAADEKLKSIASKRGIELPTSPSMTQMATKTRLEALSGDTFDKSYIKGMIKDHEQDIAMFEEEANSGQDPQAKAFAAATLPTLREHLKKIQAIAASAGVSAS
jgi:putative membrane protein